MRALLVVFDVPFLDHSPSPIFRDGSVVIQVFVAELSVGGLSFSVRYHTVGCVGKF